MDCGYGKRGLRKAFSMEVYVVPGKEDCSAEVARRVEEAGGLHGGWLGFFLPLAVRMTWSEVCSPD
jgi:hypothetical protein